jgi:hypothetical protein
MRGAHFEADAHGLYWPRVESLVITLVAIRDVAEAMGIAPWEYWGVLEREGPDILQRLPGMRGTPPSGGSGGHR